MRRLFHLAAALIAALCAGACAPAVHGRNLTAGEIGSDIRPLLQHEAPTVFIGVRDLDLDVPLRNALLAAGIAERDGDGWRFSRAGLQRSIRCSTADRAARCFPTIANARFASVVRTVDHEGGLDAEPQSTSIFAYRAAPVSDLGERLARSGVLVCGTSPGHIAVWHGSSTLAEGVFSVSTLPQTTDNGRLLDAFCPHTRLHDGVKTLFALDGQSR